MQIGVEESIPYNQENLKLRPVSLNEKPCIIELQQGYANCIHRVLFRLCPPSMFLTDATYSIKYQCGTLTESFYPVSVGHDYVEMIPFSRLDDVRGYVKRNAAILSLVSDKVLVLDHENNNLFQKASEEGNEELLKALLREQPNIDRNRPLSLQELRLKWLEAEAEKEKEAKKKAEMEIEGKATKGKQDDVPRKSRESPPEGWGVFWLPPANYEKRTYGDREYYVIQTMNEMPFKLRQGLDCNLSCSRTLNAAHEGCCWFDVSCYKLMAPVYDGGKWFFDICVNGERYTYSCLVEQLRMLPNTTNAYGNDCKRLFLNVKQGTILDRNGYYIENLKLKLEQHQKCAEDDNPLPPSQGPVKKKEYIIVRSLLNAEFDINAGRDRNLSCSMTINGIHVGCCWFDIQNEKLYHPDFDGEKWFFDMEINGVRRVYSCPVWQLRRLNTIQAPNGPIKRFFVHVKKGCVEDSSGCPLQDVNLSLELII